MNKDAYEEYELQEALIERWGELHEAHLVLEGEPTDSKFYGEHLADVIARLQAYGRVLRQLEKRAEKRA